MTVLYKLIFSKQVRKKDLPKIPERDRKRILRAIDGLQYQPRPIQALKLTNKDEYRLRQGDYRILYAIEDKVRIVEIRRVGNRKNVYEK